MVFLLNNMASKQTCFVCGRIEISNNKPIGKFLGKSKLDCKCELEEQPQIKKPVKLKEKYCYNCGNIFSTDYRNSNSKYCGEDCRKEVQTEAQKKAREKILLFLSENPEEKAKHTCKKYKQRAALRGFSFELTEEDFISNLKKPCYYCGKNYYGIGFDRVDNGIGYTKKNVVSCCTVCNKMKHASDQGEFIMRCRDIYLTFLNRKN